MTLNDWKGVLLLQEVEALEDFGYTAEQCGNREISRDEVFETIVEWNGGISTASSTWRIGFAQHIWPHAREKDKTLVSTPGP